MTQESTIFLSLKVNNSPDSKPSRSDDISELLQAEYNGIPIGRLVEKSVKWHLRNTNLESDPLAAGTLIRAIESAESFAEEFAKVISDVKPSVVIALNGSFFFESISRHICEKEGISFVTHERGYVPGTVFFSKIHDANKYEVRDKWHRRTLAPEEDKQLDEYLTRRKSGGGTVHNYWRTSTSFKSSSKYAVLFTNVTWDTAAQNRPGLFPDQFAWLRHILTKYIDSGLNLIVRFHPAESLPRNSKTREPLMDKVRTEFPELTELPNIKLIEPTDHLSSYDLAREADLVHVFTSTIGLESALMGTRVVVGGNAPYSNLGFTETPSSVAELNSIIDSKDPGRLSSEEISLARSFAHFFFFESQDDISDLVIENNGCIKIASEGELVKSTETGIFSQIARRIVKVD